MNSFYENSDALTKHISKPPYSMPKSDAKVISAPGPTTTLSGPTAPVKVCSLDPGLVMYRRSYVSSRSKVFTIITTLLVVEVVQVHFVLLGYLSGKFGVSIHEPTVLQSPEESVTRFCVGVGEG